jgi:hypothetical protein
MLLTDKAYKDFDLSRELNPDAGFNSGIFLRSTESESASHGAGRGRTFDVGFQVVREV